MRAIDGVSLGRQIHAERSTLPRLTMGGNGPTVVRHYLLADSESDTRSDVFTFPVQALKNLKDAVDVLLIEPNPVVNYVDAVENGRESAGTHIGR